MLAEATGWVGCGADISACVANCGAEEVAAVEGRDGFDLHGIVTAVSIDAPHTEAKSTQLF